MPINEAHVYKINEGLLVSNMAHMNPVAAAAARDYDYTLKEIPTKILPRTTLDDGRTMPVFDLILTGFGPDGHICSLYPESVQLSDPSAAWVLPVTNSPGVFSLSHPHSSHMSHPILPICHTPFFPYNTV